MTDERSQDRASNERRAGAEPSPDEVEQRQRPDGSVEEPPPPRVDPDLAESPDVLEQRRRADGTFDEEPVDEDLEGPVSPDVLEQRQVVEYDDEDDPRTD